MAVDAGTIYSEVRVELDKLKGDIRNVQTEFSKFAGQNKTAAKEMQKSWTDSFKNVNLSGVAAFAGLGLAVKSAISTFAGFEQSLANVQSVARGTPAEFALLEQAAKEAGETTRFTSSQAADALYNLASAGLSATESAGALSGVLSLAGATGSDLASSAAFVTATMSQYSIEAENAERISNVFAAAIANSQASMDKLTNAFRQVGPVAANLGISLEETTGALQVLFDAGFQGEQAGTALRNALGALASQTDPTTRKLISMGLTFEQLNPATNTFADIIGALGEAGLETGQVLEAFGTRAGPQMLTLLNAGKKGIEEYTAAVTGTNSAAEAYAIQNDTLAGSIDMFKSAAEAAQLSLSEGLAPALRKVVDAGAEFMKVVAGLPGPVKVFIAVVAAGIPIITGATFAVGALSAALAVLLGPVGLVLAGVAGLTAAFTGISNAAKQARTEYITENFTSLSEELGVTTEEMEKLEKEARKLGATDESVNDVVRAIHELQKEMGVTEKEIRYASDTMTRVFASGAYSAADAVDMITESAGLTREAVIKIGLATGQVTGEFRTQLEQQKNIVDKNKDRMQQEIAIYNYVQAQRQELERIKNGGKEINEEEELRKKTQAELLASLRQVDALTRAGIFTEQEGLEKKIALREALISKIQEEAEESGKASSADAKQIAESRAAIENYQARLEKLKVTKKEINDADKLANETLDQYQQKINNLVLEEEALQAAEIERVKNMLKKSGVEASAIDSVIAKVEEYHEALADDKAVKEHEAAMESLKNTVYDAFSGISGALSNLYGALADKEIAELDRRMQAQMEAEGVAEETKTERLQREYDEAVASGNAETIEKARQELRRAQIEEEFEKKRLQIRYKAERAQWGLTLLQTIAEGARAIQSGFATQPFIPAGLAAGALATTLTGLQIGTVKASKPQKPAFATGGLVLSGNRGGTDITVAERAPELMLSADPRGEQWLDYFATKVAGKTRNMIVYLEIDGARVAQAVAPVFEDGQVRLKL